MDSSNGLFGEGIFGLILFFIVAGMFNGGGFFGNNRGVDQVTNEFLFNNLANQNRDIMAGINQNGRDTLENRYTTQLGFQNLGSQMAQCCLRIFKKVQKIVGNHISNGMLVHIY